MFRASILRLSAAAPALALAFAALPAHAATETTAPPNAVAAQPATAVSHASIGGVFGRFDAWAARHIQGGVLSAAQRQRLASRMSRSDLGPQH